MKNSCVSSGRFLVSEMDLFGRHIKETELARVELEKARLAFEVRRDEKDREDREKERAVATMKEENDREERERERESRQVLELEELKAIREMFAKHK